MIQRQAWVPGTINWQCPVIISCTALTHHHSLAVMVEFLGQNHSPCKKVKGEKYFSFSPVIYNIYFFHYKQVKN